MDRLIAVYLEYTGASDICLTFVRLTAECTVARQTPPCHEDWNIPASAGLDRRGNVTDLGYAGKSSGKSSLFFIRSAPFPRDRGLASVKHRSSCGVQNALVGP